MLAVWRSSSLLFFASKEKVGRKQMSRDDLMKSDLLSEIVLLSSGVAVVIAFVMVVVLAFTRSAAL
jgi:uncharacterized membrane protein